MPFAEKSPEMWSDEVCDERWGCGEPLDGEVAEFVVSKPKEQPQTEIVEVAVMHAQCGVDAGFRQA